MGYEISRVGKINYMSVISKYKDDDKLLILEVDKGDLSNMQDVIKRWNLKDEEALWRFCLSFLLATQDRTLWIKEDGHAIRITPADHLLKG